MWLWSINSRTGHGEQVEVNDQIKSTFIFWVTTQNYNVYNGSTQKAAIKALKLIKLAA